jgi:MFS transporter, DHA1 family, staphyloferrin B biosynthesis exporter
MMIGVFVNMIKEEIWKKNFYVLWSGQFISIAGLTVLVPLLPFYMKELGATSMQSVQFWSGLALAAPAVSLAIMSPIWGKLGDRFRRKWMVVRALVALCVCLLLMATATSPLQFLVIRVIQGAFGGIVDASSAFVSMEAPKDERGKALGNLQSAEAAGALVGPLLGGILVDLWGFRPLLLTMGILTGFSALVAAFTLTEQSKKSIFNEKSRKQMHFTVLQTFHVLFSHPRARGFIMAGFAAKFAVFGLVTAFAPYVENISQSPHLAATWIGFIQAAMWGATFLSSPWWGKQNDKRSVEINYVIATLACGVSIIMQAYTESVVSLLLLRVFQGLTFSALIQSVVFVVVQYSHEQNRGVSIGATHSLLVGGQIAGSLSGAAIAGMFSPSTVFVVMGAILIVSAFFVLPRVFNQMKQSIL